MCYEKIIDVSYNVKILIQTTNEFNILQKKQKQDIFEQDLSLF